MIITTYYSLWRNRKRKTPTYKGKKVSPETYQMLKFLEKEFTVQGLKPNITLDLYQGTPSVPSRMLRSSAPSHTSFHKKGFGSRAEELTEKVDKILREEEKGFGKDK